MLIGSSSELSAHEEATCTLMDRFIESFIEEQLHIGDVMLRCVVYHRN